MTTMTRENDGSFWKKMGVAGFVFFFIKGLLWLAAPFVFVMFG